MRKFRIAIVSGPDELDRYVYFLYWMADYHPGHPHGEHRLAERGQLFKATLPDPKTLKNPEVLPHAKR